MGQVLTVQPFGNIIDLIKIKGIHLWQAFEHAVAKYNIHDRPGAFLQMSGELICAVLSVKTRCQK